ncbi:hypothetical protein FRC01_004335 [Tulasnella sp. 417]|nr:hypothetical protein FRC01_004335 [Tulasnella sp. 417]
MAGKQRSKTSKGAQTAKSEGTPVVTFRAAARALSIPELLSIIFSFCEAPELARSARVCKTWSDPALDQLWEDLEGISPLLDLVVDSESIDAARLDPTNLEILSSALSNADWPRFHSYAKRVQLFHFDDPRRFVGFLEIPVLTSGLIGTICLHHPYGPSLMPRLKRLDWSTCRSVLPIIPFISENLLHLDLELCDASDTQIKQTFNALQNRPLKLKTFRLDTNAIGAASEMAFARWLDKMDTLEQIELPPYYLTDRILNTIKSFPQLKIISQPETPNYRYNDAGTLGTLPSGSFPSLVELTLPATPAAAQRLLFNSPTDFTSLIVLNLHAPKDIEANRILGFTQQLPNHCPMIAMLELALFLSPEFRRQGVSVLPIEILESLYPCKNLVALRIGHPFPLKLTPADVENMGRSWPEMRHLCLCSDPDFYFSVAEQTGNSLSILSTFASHLPNIITLGLYFEGDEPMKFGGHLHPKHQFIQLHSLLVGLSPIPKTHSRDIGFYLASLCSETVRVSYGHGAWRGEMMPPDTAERAKAWREVGEVMVFAMRIKLAKER